MLVQLFSLHAPQVLARPWLHPVHPQSSENVICNKMVFSQDQRVLILEHYFSTRSYAECQNAFRNSFPDSVVPNKSTIQRLVERFHETGCIGEKRRSGRPSVLSNGSLEDIRARLLQSPRKSLRKLSQQTGMTCRSAQRATKRLRLHPYRVQVCHELKEIDKEKRMRYCRWFRQFVRNGVDVLEKVLSEASCVLKSSSNYWRFKTIHWSCHIEYFPRNFKESSAKHDDTCEYMLRRKWRSFSTFTVKYCKLFLNMFVYVINCFNKTRPTDCPFTP
jgi:transposase